MCTIQIQTCQKRRKLGCVPGLGITQPSLLFLAEDCIFLSLQSWALIRWALADVATGQREPGGGIYATEAHLMGHLCTGRAGYVFGERRTCPDLNALIVKIFIPKSLFHISVGDSG